MTRTRPFGRLEDGTAVQAFRLGGGHGLSAEILDLGGILARLEFPGAQGRTPLVLGLADAQAYFRDPAYLGILVGRCGAARGAAPAGCRGRCYPAGICSKNNKRT